MKRAKKMPNKLRIQIYSVRNIFKKNPIGTLEKVAKAGYKYLELANHDANIDYGWAFGLSADELNKYLNKFNLKVISTHVMSIDENNIAKIIAFHNQIGFKSIVIAIDFFSDKSSVLEKCELYNKLGKLFKQSGISLLYHNHFQKL